MLWQPGLSEYCIGSMARFDFAIDNEVDLRDRTCARFHDRLCRIRQIGSRPQPGDASVPG